MTEAGPRPNVPCRRWLWPWRLSLQPLGRLLLEIFPEVGDHLHLLELRFGKLHVVLVLDRGDELHQVERVGRQVASEALVHLHLVWVDAEDLRRELLQLLEFELACHCLSSLSSWPQGP